MINIGIGIGWAKAIYSVANNIIANFKARVATYPGSIFEAGPCLDTTLEELNAIGLLDNASLVITPNAYNETKLYDVIPNTTLGDMDVVRATTATRVNELGLIEVVPRNLVTYSEQFDNASWNKLACSVTLNSIISPNGTLTADSLIESDTNSRHMLFRSFVSVIGQSYTLSLFCKKNTRRYVNLNLKNSTGASPRFSAIFDLETGLNLSTSSFGSPTGTSFSIIDFNNGWYKVSITMNLTSVSTNYEISTSNSPTPTLSEGTPVYLGNGISGIYIWGAQLEESPTATEYFPTTTRLNIPRIDYTNGTCPSLLVEPQRTNLFSYSEQFDDVSWTKTNVTVTSNTSIAPTGNLTADTIANAIGLIGSILKQITVVNNSDTYNSSFFVKKQSGFLVFQIRYLNGVTPVGCAIHFDKLTGAFLNINSSFGFTGVPVNIKAESYGDYFRFSYSLANNSTSNTTLRIEVQPHRGTSLGNLSQTNGNAVMWGAQLEQGSYATSYIPTVASTVTRNADVISKTGISSLINSQEGVLFADLQFFTEIGNIRSINISNGSNNNRIGFYGHPSVANRITFAISSGGATTDINYSGVILTNRNKVLIRYSGTTFTAFVNGVKSANQTFTPFTANFLNRIGLDYGEDILRYEGRINSIQLYKTALTDQECIALTTL